MMREHEETLGRYSRRVRYSIGFGKITLVDDSGPIQQAQMNLGPIGSDGSLRIWDGAPVLQHFGFSSRPPVGSDALALFVGGDPSNGVVVASGHKDSRPTGLSEGDAMLYSSRGQRVWLADDAIHIDGAGLPVVASNVSSFTIAGPTIIQGADLTVNGDASVGGNAIVEINAVVGGSLRVDSLAE